LTFILEKGIDPNIKGERKYYSHTPSLISIACSNNNETTFNLLLKYGADINSNFDDLLDTVSYNTIHYGDYKLKFLKSLLRLKFPTDVMLYNIYKILNSSDTLYKINFYEFIEREFDTKHTLEYYQGEYDELSDRTTVQAQSIPETLEEELDNIKEPLDQIFEECKELFRAEKYDRLTSVVIKYNIGNLILNDPVDIEFKNTIMKKTLPDRICRFAKRNNVDDIKNMFMNHFRNRNIEMIKYVIYTAVINYDGTPIGKLLKIYNEFIEIKDIIDYKCISEIMDENDTESLSEILKYDIRGIKFKNNYLTFLHISCNKYNIKMTEYILLNTEIDVNTESSIGTIIHVAQYQTLIHNDYEFTLINPLLIEISKKRYINNDELSSINIVFKLRDEEYIDPSEEFCKFIKNNFNRDIN